VAVAALESPAPYSADGLDWFAGMGESNIELFKTALDGRDAMEQLIGTASGLLNADPETLIKNYRSLLSPVDAAVFKEDLAAYFYDIIHEGIEERRDGWVDDNIAFTTPWGFELDQIKIPVMVMHGEQDRFVSISHGEWITDNIPNVDARLLADDGHITLLINRIPEVHAWLMDKIE
jgi:pimeloyl-ACP methyl ester carboxylesterase